MWSKWLECDIGARQADLSISETADLLGFSHTNISRVYREWSEKEKISSERQFCGWKCLVDSRGQRRAGRKATVTEITTHYNRGMQKSISKHTTLKQMSTAAEDSGCRSCQLRTGNWGYNSHRLAKIKQKIIWIEYKIRGVLISALTFRW